MLDSYTINTPRFLEEYQKSNEQEKVELTINKVFEALNNKDFKYIYGKLDENYKNAYLFLFIFYKISLYNTTKSTKHPRKPFPIRKVLQTLLC